MEKRHDCQTLQIARRFEQKNNYECIIIKCRFSEFLEPLCDPNQWEKIAKNEYGLMWSLNRPAYYLVYLPEQILPFLGRNGLLF